jgi:hypothetical protein
VIVAAVVMAAGACECDKRELADAGDVGVQPEFGVNDVVLVQAAGHVETRRSGEWGEAQVGQRLSTDDAVRARAGGAAKVAIGAGAEVAVGSRSEVSFGEVAGGRARVKLERGRMRADLSGDDLVLQVQSAGSPAVAEAKRGSFAVFTDGHGRVAVATRAGEVKLESSGGAVTIAAGEEAAVVGDAQPAKEVVPESVYLKVRWPEQRMTRETEVAVRGQADSSSHVEVNGQVVVVAEDGTFEAQVKLEDGRNRVEVRATDLHERTATEETSVVVRRRAPTVKAKSEGIWE